LETSVSLAVSVATGVTVADSTGVSVGSEVTSTAPVASGDTGSAVGSASLVESLFAAESEAMGVSKLSLGVFNEVESVV
jgi:hypothetical protein